MTICSGTKKTLSERTVIYWHARMFNRTKPQFAGQIREYPVGVRGSRAVFPDWERVPGLLREYFEWYEKSRGKLNPVELAALAHLKLTTIHPFGDGNGRTARLVMNYVLDNFGYPLLDIRFADRKKYARAQERAQISGNDVHFLQWFTKYYLKAHRRHLETRSK